MIFSSKKRKRISVISKHVKRHKTTQGSGPPFCRPTPKGPSGSDKEELSADPSLPPESDPEYIRFLAMDFPPVPKPKVVGRDHSRPCTVATLNTIKKQASIHRPFASHERWPCFGMHAIQDGFFQAPSQVDKM